MSDKSEKPTERRVKKAREDGNYLSAKEFVSAMQFCVFLCLLGAWGAKWFAGFRATARRLFLLPFTIHDLNREIVTHYAWQIFMEHIAPLLGAGVIIALATMVFRLASTKFGFSFKKIAPDFSRLSPMNKLKQLPGNNAAAVAQAVIMLPLFSYAIYAVAKDKLELFLTLPFHQVEDGFGVFTASAMSLCWKAAGLFILVGAVDLFRQLKKYNSQLSMSKQDIKDEHKEAEGNPQMKAKVRRIQRDNARRQMMKEIPTATAVVVNPTHYAVALRYSMDANAAPVVVAKGKNYLALRIKQKAMDHSVPIIENPPLARALYAACEPGQEIPPQLYKAVAEILAYIYKLMNGRRG
ncbi:MAG TPA: EscU/YscU/HrcU family type III secretion system export apparatus switch protein [Bryobacteraceae bacterium]|jgi:flagellar biosynthetic protein FlhB|nr:EscU/YscU/HrcU family type III secretion system export apparatus switch protein [Bryobacteraceae bacterium]